VSQALLAAFRHAVSAVPAYRQLLAEHGVEPAAIVDRRTFAALCPVLSKASTLEGIDRLCSDMLRHVAGADFALHLCYETPRTLDVQRAALQDAGLARELFGQRHSNPRVLEYDERGTLIETLELDSQGYGWMTVSLFDQALPMPVIRCQTGYLVRLLDPSRVMLAMWRRGYDLSGPLPSALLALAGRAENDGTTTAGYVAGGAIALL
jgi:hypothetical protein